MNATFVCSKFAVMQRVARVRQRQLILVLLFYVYANIHVYTSILLLYEHPRLVQECVGDGSSDGDRHTRWTESRPELETVNK